MTSTAASSVLHWLNYACKSRKLYLRKGPLVNLTQENEVYMTFDYFYSLNDDRGSSHLLQYPCRTLVHILYYIGMYLSYMQQ